MIATLKGTIRARSPEGIVLEVGGVGYRLAMSARALNAVGDPGDEAFVYTHMYVREDAMSLYGFIDPEERAFFEVLIGVSGVGPRVAMAVLSAYSPEDLRRAVVDRDVALFQSISGIGRKTAERLVLELKDKVGAVAPEEPVAGGKDDYYLAREALVGLGFNFAEAEAALAACSDEGAGVEEMVRQALKHAAGKAGGD